MLGVLKIFFHAKATNPWVVLLCLVLSGFFGGVGLVGLLPLLSIAAGEEQASDSAVTETVFSALNALGIEPGMVPLLCMIVAAIILKCVFQLVAVRYFGRAAANVVADLRGTLLKQLLNAQWRYFSAQPLGRFANSMSFDAMRSGKAYSMAAQFMSTTIQTVVLIVVAFAVSWELSLIALAIGGVIALSLHYLVRIARKAGNRETKRTLTLVVFLTDALNSIKPLKAMEKQSHFANLCDRKIQALKEAMRRQIVAMEDHKSLQEILMAVALGVAFYFAIAVASYPLSEVLVMGIILSRTMSNVGRIQGSFQKAVVLESPYYAMKELIAEAEAASEKRDGSTTPTLTTGLRLDNVQFSFGANPVLKGASLSVPVGEITVLTGPSGGGKTTVTDLCLGFYRPDAGRVLIDEVPLDQIDIKQWRSLIGYVPQELILFHDTVFANVALGNDRLGEAEVREALEAAGAWDFVSALPDGLMSSVGEKGSMLSGGQRQRIALARALATKPKLLILDEVTSALDPEIEIDICRLVQSLAEDRAIIAITHRPAFLDVADRLYRLQDGRVDKIDTKETALLDPGLATGT